MNGLWNLQITFFLLVIAGFFMTKKKIITADARKVLTDLVIDFILPCNIITSFLIEFNHKILASCAMILLVSIGIQLFCSFIGHYIYPGCNEDEKTVLRYATTVSNAGFLGSPVVEGLYGAQGLLYASIYLIPVRMVMWTAGVSCFTKEKGRGVVKKMLTHPCIIAVIIGLILMLFQISLPGSIEKTLQIVGSCNTGLSMLVIGSILSDIKMREILNREVAWYCLVRLIIIPIVVFVLCSILRMDKMVIEVATILAGMPAATSTAMLASKYQGNESFAVKLVFLSTVLSLATIPVLCVGMNLWQ